MTELGRAQPRRQQRTKNFDFCVSLKGIGWGGGEMCRLSKQNDTDRGRGRNRLSGQTLCSGHVAYARAEPVKTHSNTVAN